jgi:hypothetical protein
MSYRRIRTLLLACGVCLLHATAVDGRAQQREPFNYGQWWTAATPGAKSAYVQGYNDGLHDAIALSWELSGRVPGDPRRTRALNLTAVQRDALARIHDDYRAARAPANFPTTVIVANVTAFYQEPANAFVWPHSAIRISIMTLRGTPADQVQRELEIARAAALPPTQ